MVGGGGDGISSVGVSEMRLERARTGFTDADVDLHLGVSTVTTRLGSGLPLTPLGKHATKRLGVDRAMTEVLRS